MRDIAQDQARLWVDAELGKLDLADDAQLAHRIGEAQRALRMIRDCNYEFPRASWMHGEILRRLHVARRAAMRATERTASPSATFARGAPPGLARLDLSSTPAPIMAPRPPDGP